MTDKKDIKKMQGRSEGIRIPESRKKMMKLRRRKRKSSKKTREIEQYNEQLLRLQADFENFKKRTEKELSDQIRYANEHLILKILDTYEDFERALEIRELR